MTYENPEEYISEEKRRKEMLKKAIQYMDKLDEDAEKMDSEDIVKAAETFNNFVKKEEKE